MSRGERLNFQEFDQYFCVSHIINFAIAGGPTQTSVRRAVWANDGARVKVEPSQPRYGRFDDLNRIIFCGNQQTANPANITFQLQLSRNGVAWTNIGDPINPFNAAGGSENGVPVGLVAENPLPPDLFTNPAEAGTIDDDVLARFEIDGVDDSGWMSALVFFIPSLGSTGARYGQRGNVFSGPSY